MFSADPRPSAAEGEAACEGPPTNCNEDRTVCCDFWYADSIQGGAVKGGILEESYTKLLARIESSKATDEKLCKYWGGSSCGYTYGAPRCSGDPSAGILKKQVLESAPLGTVADALENAATLLPKLETASQAYAVFEAVQKFQTHRSSGASVMDSAAQTLIEDHAEHARKELNTLHRATDEYITELKAGVDRVRALRERLEACVKFNPFLETQRSEEPSSDLPRPWRTANFAGGGFGGHEEDEALEQQREDAKKDAGSLAKRSVPQLPIFEKLGVTSGSVITTSVTGNGRLLMGKTGSMEMGESLSSGERLVAFVVDDGRGLVFGRVQISRTGEMIKIVGQATTKTGTHREEMVILDCVGGKKPVGSTCSCPDTTAWDGARCACPAGWTLSGSTCTAPPPPAPSPTPPVTAKPPASVPVPSLPVGSVPVPVAKPSAAPQAQALVSCTDNGASCSSDSKVLSWKSQCASGLSQAPCYCMAAATYGCFIDHGCYGEAGAKQSNGQPAIPLATLQSGLAKNMANAASLGKNCGL